LSVAKTGALVAANGSQRGMNGEKMELIRFQTAIGLSQSWVETGTVFFDGS
jgi:hypothetical protein